MIKSGGDALQHGVLAACVFAGDRQNSRHVILIHHS